MEETKGQLKWRTEPSKESKKESKVRRMFVRPWRRRRERTRWGRAARTRVPTSTIVSAGAEWNNSGEERAKKGEEDSARHNKSPSTVDVTKMNCYIVLTNEGRTGHPVRPSPSVSVHRVQGTLSSVHFLLFLFFFFFRLFVSTHNSTACIMYLEPPLSLSRSLESISSSPSSSSSSSSSSSWSSWPSSWSSSWSSSSSSFGLLSARWLVLQSAREARVLPVPIVSCMINGPGAVCPAGTASYTHRLSPFGLSIPLDSFGNTRGIPRSSSRPRTRFPRYWVIFIDLPVEEDFRLTNRITYNRPISFRRVAFYATWCSR